MSIRLCGGVLGLVFLTGCPAEQGGESIEPLRQALSGDNMGGANLAGSNLAGSNLAGSNLAGANLGGTNLAGSNLAGSNLGGTNLGGNNLGGNNLAGSNLAGSNLAGSNLAGSNLAGSNLAGSNLAGSNLAGSNIGGNNLAGSNLAGSNLAGSNSGANIHNLTGSTTGMLYSREDAWTPRTASCVVMGIGSTAFPKLLAQQSANAKINVALGKLPWGFSSTAGGPKTLNAWEAVVWGDNTYCVFVLVAEPSVTYPGVQGFIKAIFRWNAPPTQSMDISGIDAARSAPVSDMTTATTVTTYTGMMNAAAKWKAGTINETAFMAGELAFASATTNNQSVLVDFSSWVRDTSNNSLVLGNVTAVNPPTYAEAVYIALDLGNGNVKVVLDDSSARTPVMPNVGGAPMINSVWDLDRAYKAYRAGTAPKPVARRCAGSLFLFKHYGEPLPAGQCDTGLEWAFGFCARGGSTWSAVAGTTAPMNSYMQMTNAAMPYQRTIEINGNSCGPNLLPVLSETYVHMWERNYDVPGTCTAESNTTFCTRNGATCGSVTAIDNCGNARTVSCGGACPAATTTTYEAEAPRSTIAGNAYALVCNKSAAADATLAAAGCDRGEIVRGLGMGSTNYVTINNITAPSAGIYRLTVWGVVGPDVAGNPQTRRMYISVNGGSGLVINITGASWTVPVSTTANIMLNAGSSNSIKFHNPNGELAPDLDRIEIAPPAATVSLTVYDAANAASWAVRSNFQIGSSGAHPWPDYSSTYVGTWHSSLNNLLGKTWIQTMSASKSYTGTYQAALGLSGTANVYLMIDDRWGTSPAWMSGWTDTGYNVVIKESGTTDRVFSVFKKSNVSGTVNLPKIGSNTAMNYFAIVE
jgi:hypothetical protein